MFPISIHTQLRQAESRDSQLSNNGFRLKIGLFFDKDTVIFVKKNIFGNIQQDVNHSIRNNLAYLLSVPVVDPVQ